MRQHLSHCRKIIGMNSFLKFFQQILKHIRGYTCICIYLESEITIEFVYAGFISLLSGLKKHIRINLLGKCLTSGRTNIRIFIGIKYKDKLISHYDQHSRLSCKLFSCNQVIRESLLLGGLTNISENI